MLAPCSLKRCSVVLVAMNLVQVTPKLSFRATFLSFIPRNPPPTLWTFVTKSDGLRILNTQRHVQGGWEVGLKGLQGVAGVAFEDIIAEMVSDLFEDFGLALAKPELMFSV